MAGLYRRFREAGYTTPKFLLPVGERSILQWIVAELAPERLLLIANERDRPHEAQILQAVAAAGVPNVVVQFIGDTSGQAETAAIGARFAVEQGWNGPLIFHNIDTVVLERDLGAIAAVLAQADGFIDVFVQDSAAYSYVAVTNGFVTRIAEKVVISPHATTGLYGFASPTVYLRAAAITTARSGGEFYISDVYQRMLDDGARIAVRPDPKHRTLVLGTPAQYEAHIAQSQA